MQDDLVAVPDGITPLQGYRFFRVDHTCRLAALGFDFFWNPGGTTTALCLPPTRVLIRPTRGRRHVTPDESCTCGLHAMKRLDDLWAGPGPAMGPFVAARVELWGKVIEATRGYRAQYGRVVELIVFAYQEHLADFVAAVYGVPLRIRTPAEAASAGSGRPFPWMPPNLVGRGDRSPSGPHAA